MDTHTILSISILASPVRLSLTAGAGRQVRADAAARQSPVALALTTRRAHIDTYRHVRGATLFDVPFLKCQWLRDFFMPVLIGKFNVTSGSIFIDIRMEKIFICVSVACLIKYCFFLKTFCFRFAFRELNYSCLYICNLFIL